MWFFFATVLIGWVMMVIIPVLGGGAPVANLGILSTSTVAALVVWRVAGGRGWGLSPEPDQSVSEESVLPDDWSAALKKRGNSTSELARNVNQIYNSAHGGGSVRPERRDVFRAFQLTSLDAVRVVILGQDPYPSKGEADGLAFSARAGARIPHSLERIFSNLESDPDVRFHRPSSADLSKWAYRGVLLLNTALTVGPNGLSHRWRWDSFTGRVLEAVNDSERSLVFMLWGDDANDIADQVGVDAARHKLIRSTHPRREEASRYPRFSSTRPFSEANKYLRSQGGVAIDWSL